MGRTQNSSFRRTGVEEEIAEYELEQDAEINRETCQTMRGISIVDSLFRITLRWNLSLFHASPSR